MDGWKTFSFPFRMAQPGPFSGANCWFQGGGHMCFFKPEGSSKLFHLHFWFRIFPKTFCSESLPSKSPASYTRLINMEVTWFMVKHGSFHRLICFFKNTRLLAAHSSLEFIYSFLQSDSNSSITLFFWQHRVFQIILVLFVSLFIVFKHGLLYMLVVNHTFFCFPSYLHFYYLWFEDSGVLNSSPIHMETVSVDSDLLCWVKRCQWIC